MKRVKGVLCTLFVFFESCLMELFKTRKIQGNWLLFQNYREPTNMYKIKIFSFCFSLKPNDLYPSPLLLKICGFRANSICKWRSPFKLVLSDEKSQPGGIVTGFLIL